MAALQAIDRSRRAARQPVCGHGSCEPVSDKELQRTIKPNMGQGRCAVTGRFEGRGAKTHETEIRLLLIGEAAKCRSAWCKQDVRVIRKFAWKHRNFGLAVEDVFGTRCLLARCRYA